MTKVDVTAFGLMLGLIWSVCVFMLGIVSMASDWGLRTVRLFARVYIGYQGTVSGSFIGAVWGFLDGAISGIVIAWVYNKIVF